MKYFLSIDQGTTSSRAIVFTERGDKVAVAQQRIQQYYPQPGWVEHDPEDIWQSVVNTCQQAIAKAELTASDITAIGITNQRETTVLWDKSTGKTIHNAIVWQDRRTHDFCEKLREEGYQDKIQQKTGLLLDPYFSATKIHWLLDNVSQAKQLLKNDQLCFGTIDSFLLWRLSEGKVHATDITNASRTMLFNIQQQTWDQELLDLFSIPESILPEVKSNCSDFAETSLFGGCIPVLAMAGDQQSASIGQACIHPGMLKSTYGTGAFLLLNTGEKPLMSKHRLLTTVAYRINGTCHYALEGSIFSAASTINWLRDSLGLITDARESETLAASLEDNAGVYLIPAFAGLGAPYWRADVKAMLYGLSFATTKAHIVRAALEAVVYQTQDLINVMQEDGAESPLVLRVDGGMTKNQWLLQFLANVTGINVAKPNNVETTAWGVAALAALHAGVYSSLDELATLWQEQQHFISEESLATHAKESYQQWRRILLHHLL